ncbi:SRR1-like protein [Phytophthora ramorum]|uniref:SRR1-like protein n=1 Tax=Phytophthora ramorum TaxID=164328 RepID=UPI003098385A|nr:SRR1-like protein [Phytophthora ramorum]
MDQEWQLVSRRRRGKPRNGPPHPQSAPPKALKTATSGQSATANSKPRNAAGEEAVEPVAEVSAEKKKQIIRRVRAIADVLRDSLLLKDALQVVVENFELSTGKTEEVKTEEEPASRPMLVGYGLGSFCTSSNAVHQLGFLVALKEALDEGKAVEQGCDKIQHCAEIFDPAMNKSDAAITKHFKLKVLQENEHGRRRVERNTVFFMPHCGKALYQNVLACNWGPEMAKLVIIGNSFSAYGDRVLAAKERQELLLVCALPYLEEKTLSCGVIKTHEDFARYEAAFNDLSVHRFPPQLLASALHDTSLSEKMAVVASATADQSDDGEA